MNSSHPQHLAPHCFPARIGEPDHLFDGGLYLVEPVAQLANSAELGLDLREAILDRGQSSRNVVVGTAHRFADVGDTLAFQDRGEVAGMPPKRYRQCFERSRAPPALRGIVVKLANGRL